MLAVTFRVEKVMIYCGFLNSTFMKTLFYIFLSSLAFSDLRNWPADLIGFGMAGMAVVSWMIHCGKDKPAAK